MVTTDKHRTCRFARIGVVLLLTAVMIGGASFVFPKAYATSKPGRVNLTSAKSASYNSIKLTWKKAARAKKYEVYCAPSKNGKYKLVGTTNKLNFTHKKLKLGKAYYYKVRGVNGKVKGAFSKVKGATPVLGKPRINSDCEGVSCILTYWNPVAGAHYYEVQRDSGPVYAGYEDIGTSYDEWYTDYDLEMNEDSPVFYYYRVRAVRKVGGKLYRSAWSNEVMGSMAVEDKALTDGLNVKIVKRGSGNLIAVVKNNNSVTVDVYFKVRFFGDDKEHAVVIDEGGLIDMVPGKTSYVRLSPVDDDVPVSYSSYKLYYSAKEVDEAYTDYSDKIEVKLDSYSNGLVSLTATNDAGVDITADVGFVFLDKNGNVLDFNSDVVLMSKGESQPVLLSTIDLGAEAYDSLKPVVFRAGEYY